jgi:hypothetical protein
MQRWTRPRQRSTPSPATTNTTAGPRGRSPASISTRKCC